MQPTRWRLQKSTPNETGKLFLFRFSGLILDSVFVFLFRIGSEKVLKTKHVKNGMARRALAIKTEAR